MQKKQPPPIILNGYGFVSAILQQPQTLFETADKPPYPTLPNEKNSNSTNENHTKEIHE